MYVQYMHAGRGQRRTSDSSELELQMVVSCYVCTRKQLGSLQKWESLVTTEPSLQSLTTMVLRHSIS